jgi:erythromycin esterase
MSGTARATFLERARKTRSLVHSLDLDADIADLRPLDAIVGDARVVGIGESWHSAHELVSLRHRMVRYLVERRGFNLLIFEGSVAGAEMVDRYVKGGDGDPALVLRYFEQAMWLNRETAGFLVWLRTFNATRSLCDRVGVCGMDVAPPTAALTSITGYLKRVDPRYSIPAEELVDHFNASCHGMPLSSTTRAAIWGATEVFEKLGSSARMQVRAALATIASRLLEMRKTYETSSSVDELRWVTRHAVVAVQACDVLAARLKSPREANYLRDLAFSENVAWLLDHGHPKSKAVIFGHNIHMAKEAFRSFDSEQLVTSLGERLAKWYGRSYVAIGSSVGTGRLSATPGMVDVAAAANSRRESSLRSIDAVLEELGENGFLLALPADLEWVNTPQSMRSHLEPTTDYTPAVAFDALAYVDSITAATVLPD